VTLLVLTGDLHVNSTVALCPPTVELDDGGTYYASKSQAWIYNRWVDFWAKAAEVQRQHECEVVTILNGELADDLRHASTQLISKNEEDHARASLAVLEPVRALSDRIIVTRGSEAHSGTNSSRDEKIARAIGAETDEQGRSAHWHYRGVIGGLRIDVAHHPGTGHMRPWTRGGDANRLAAMTVYSYAENGLEPPDVTIRGHNHKPSDSADNHPTRAIILPSWQLTGAFGYRLGSGAAPLPIGGMMMLIDQGEIAWERKVFHRWPLKPWKALS
jgi:hypothetical protein